MSAKSMLPVCAILGTATTELLLAGLPVSDLPTTAFRPAKYAYGPNDLKGLPLFPEDKSETTIGQQVNINLSTKY